MKSASCCNGWSARICLQQTLSALLSARTCRVTSVILSGWALEIYSCSVTDPIIPQRRLARCRDSWATGNYWWVSCYVDTSLPGTGTPDLLRSTDPWGMISPFACSSLKFLPLNPGRRCSALNLALQLPGCVDLVALLLQRRCQSATPSKKAPMLTASIPPVDRTD